MNRFRIVPTLATHAESVRALRRDEYGNKFPCDHACKMHGRASRHFVGSNGRTWPPGTSLSTLEGAKPSGGVREAGTLLYVNGVGIEKDRQAKELQLIAERTGKNVVGLHNATEGFPADMLQAAKGKLNVGTNAAEASLTQAVLNELAPGRPVHLFTHSQGRSSRAARSKPFSGRSSRVAEAA